MFLRQIKIFPMEIQKKFFLKLHYISEVVGKARWLLFFKM